MPSAMPASLESATSRPDSVVHETNNGVLGISSRMRLRISIAERTSPTETACNQIAPERRRLLQGPKSEAFAQPTYVLTVSKRFARGHTRYKKGECSPGSCPIKQKNDPCTQNTDATPLVLGEYNRLLVGRSCGG